MAQQFISTDRAITAILDMVRTAKIDDAVATYTSYQEDIGFQILSKVGNDAPMQKAVANLFYRARDYPKAAMSCENLGEYEKAALLYEKCQDYEMAADMYARLNMPVRAAEMYEKGQKFRQAAELFMQSGDSARAAVNFERALSHFHAGQLYFQLERLQKSMELLQKVKREEDEFVEAALLIAYILERNGHLDLALRKLSSVKGSEMDARNAKVAYRMVDVLLKKEERDEAIKLLSEIVAWDFNYLDANARLSDLQGGGVGTQNAVMPELEAGVPELEVLAEADDVVSVMNGFEYLKQLPLFEELSLQEMKTLYTRCEERAFTPGTTLIEQGAAGQALFILIAGEYEVRRRAESGEVKAIAMLGPGSYVGEMSLIDDAPTSAEVVAKTAGTALVVSKDSFHAFLNANDHVALRVYRVFVQTMCTRLRAANEKLSAKN
jgi:tetratricopeptide (TPR) repeat protein